MKRISDNILGGESRTEVLQIGNKKYIRIASSRGVEWKRYKTKHQVKQVEFDALEGLYNKTFPVQFVPSSFMKKQVKRQPDHVEKIINDKERRRIEEGLLKASERGTKLLAGVKYIKEQTNWGLKESKDFVDNFFARRAKW